jgi:DNA helicase HerA-like ATPase
VYQNTAATQEPVSAADLSIGRIVSVTGSKAIVLLDDSRAAFKSSAGRPEMGTLLAIDTELSIGLGLVSALSVPVPAQKDGDPEVWIAELSLVGEIQRPRHDHPGGFNRGLTAYPALGDRVRVASREELLKAFSAPGESAVKVGVIRQDSSIAAMVKTDDLLGKHFAILGTTGTGKSCTTALILRAILDKNPEAHIVLLDPHNEYATSFGERAEVISTQNLHLPYWLLTFEELVEVLIGTGDDRKQEVEILQELIPVCKGRYGKSMRETERAVKRTSIYSGRYSVDTPVPYRMSDLLQLLDDKMGMLENKKDLSPYRSLKTRVDTISQDQRYAFMFGGFTVNDQMAEILGRIFRVPVAGKPITIIELTGLPTEIVNVVVSVLCRMTFDFALWGEGKVPVTLVCEEAHRYVPANASMGFEPAKRAIAKIAKEGRKYGASLCIVTQRPAEIDATILSQCNTVFALRMSNDRDQEIVRAAVSDTGSGMLEFLPSLGQREAIAFGDGVSLPVRIKFDELPKSALPRSSTARFSEMWQKSVGDEGFVQSVVDRWRASGSPHSAVASDELLAAELPEHVPSEQPLRRFPPVAAGAPHSNVAAPRLNPAAGSIPAPRPTPAPSPVAAGRRVLVTPPPTPAPEPSSLGSGLRRSGLAASLLRRKE